MYVLLFLCADLLHYMYMYMYMGSLPPIVFWSPSTGRRLAEERLHNELVDLRGNIRVLCSEDREGTQADVVVLSDRDNDGVMKVLT